MDSRDAFRRSPLLATGKLLGPPREFCRGVGSRDAFRQFPFGDKGELLRQLWDLWQGAGRPIPETLELLGRPRPCQFLWLRPLLEVAEAAWTVLC